MTELEIKAALKKLYPLTTEQVDKMLTYAFVGGSSVTLHKLRWCDKVPIDNSQNPDRIEALFYIYSDSQYTLIMKKIIINLDLGGSSTELYLRADNTKNFSDIQSQLETFRQDAMAVVMFNHGIRGKSSVVYVFKDKLLAVLYVGNKIMVYEETVETLRAKYPLLVIKCYDIKYNVSVDDVLKSIYSTGKVVRRFVNKTKEDGKVYKLNVFTSRYKGYIGIGLESGETIYEGEGLFRIMGNTEILSTMDMTIDEIFVDDGDYVSIGTALFSWSTPIEIDDMAGAGQC